MAHDFCRNLVAEVHQASDDTVYSAVEDPRDEASLKVLNDQWSWVEDVGKVLKNDLF